MRLRVVFTITFDEDVTGVDASQIELTGTAAADASITQVAGSGTTYTVTVDAADAEGTLGLSVLTGQIEDAYGNLFVGAVMTSETYTIERTATVQVLAVGTNAGKKSKPIVNVYNAATGELLSTITAYASTFTGGVKVATGDLDGDGIDEIVVSPASKRQPDIKVYRVDGTELTNFEFSAGDSFDKHGSTVTVGDVDGDGWNDIITGSSGTQRSYVKVFKNNYTNTPNQAFSSTPLTQFEAFDKNYTSGVTLATGEVNEDGAADIIVGANKGQVTKVSVFSMTNPNVPTFTQIMTMNPFGDKFKGGVSVSAGDIDGDGAADIIAAAGSKGNSQVQMFNGLTGTPIGNPFTAFQTSPRLPVNVVAKDLDSDGVIDEIFAALGSNSTKTPIKRYLSNGQPSPSGVDFVLETNLAFSYGIQLG